MMQLDELDVFGWVCDKTKEKKRIEDKLERIKKIRIRKKEKGDIKGVETIEEKEIIEEDKLEKSNARKKVFCL